MTFDEMLPYLRSGKKIMNSNWVHSEYIYLKNGRIAFNSVVDDDFIMDTFLKGVVDNNDDWKLYRKRYYLGDILVKNPETGTKISNGKYNYVLKNNKMYLINDDGTTDMIHLLMVSDFKEKEWFFV